MFMYLTVLPTLPLCSFLQFCLDQVALRKELCVWQDFVNNKNTLKRTYTYLVLESQSTWENGYKSNFLMYMNQGGSRNIHKRSPYGMTCECEVVSNALPFSVHDKHASNLRPASCGWRPRGCASSPLGPSCASTHASRGWCPCDRPWSNRVENTMIRTLCYYWKKQKQTKLTMYIYTTCMVASLLAKH